MLFLFCSDTEKFDFQKFSEYYDDYKSAIEFTSGILFLEIVYRLLVCLFEVSIVSLNIVIFSSYEHNLSMTFSYVFIFTTHVALTDNHL